MKKKNSLSHELLPVCFRVDCCFEFPFSHSMGWKMLSNALKILLNCLY